MKKRILFFLPVLVVVAGLVYLGTLAPIITGYAAKNLASGIFVAGRDQESLEKTDLNFSFIKYNRNKVDYGRKEVTSRFLFWKSRAIYVDGFGCTLVRGYSDEEIKGRPYTIVAPPACNPDTIPWPMGDLLADSIPSGINMDKLTLALDRAMSDTIPMKGTFAVTVVYKGQIVAERYHEGFTPNTRFLSWSMAKSFTGTLAGLLVAEKRLKVDAPAPVAEWSTDSRKNITLTNLLQMNSGLEWNEDYGSNSDVNCMLFKEGDMGSFAVDKPVVESPGSHWYYSSGTTNIVSRIIRETIANDSAYYAFPRSALFNKIGMRSAVFETDASGTFIGSSYVYATIRDYARYGLLYLNRGNWLGHQLIAEEWVDFSVREAEGSNGEYGAFFWLNRSDSYPGVPKDMFCARGHDGQYIYIIPSLQLVVVRTGFSKKGMFDLREFLRSITLTIEAA